PGIRCQRTQMFSRNARYSGVCTAAIGPSPQSAGSSSARPARRAASSSRSARSGVSGFGCGAPLEMKIFGACFLCCSAKMTFIPSPSVPQALESRTGGLEDQLVLLGLEPEAAVEALRPQVGAIDRQAQVRRALGPRDAHGLGEQPAAEAAAPRFVRNVEILHVQAHFPPPRGEIIEVQAEADRLTRTLRDERVERGLLAKAERPEILRPAANLLLQPGRAREAEQQRVQAFGVFRRRRANHDVGVGLRTGAQKFTLSAPLRPSISRASAGVAISNPSSSSTRRILATCSALLRASVPRPISRLSSRPTRTCPPMIAP